VPDSLEKNVKKDLAELFMPNIAALDDMIGKVDKNLKGIPCQFDKFYDY